MPKVYSNMQELVNDGGWMELKTRAEDRHYCKIGEGVRAAIKEPV